MFRVFPDSYQNWLFLVSCFYWLLWVFINFCNCNNSIKITIKVVLICKSSGIIPPIVVALVISTAFLNHWDKFCWMMAKFELKDTYKSKVNYTEIANKIGRENYSFIQTLYLRIKEAMHITLSAPTPKMVTHTQTIPRQ